MYRMLNALPILTRTLSPQLLLDELGMNQEFFDVLREEYIKPITSVLYPEYGGATLDSHKVFVVKYKVGEDEDLACHFDNAEVGDGAAGILRGQMTVPAMIVQCLTCNDAFVIYRYIIHMS